MPSPAESFLPPPEGFQAFEKLVCTCAKLRWDSKDFRLLGRGGQAQLGVDVYGHDKKDRFIVYQCKNTPEKLTMATIQKEIRKAEAFDPPIQHFCIATSAKKDTPIERQVLVLCEQRKKQRKFTVEVLFWGDLQDLLCDSPAALRKHYGGFGLDAMQGPDARLVKDRERFDELQKALPYAPTVRLFAEHDFRQPFPYDQVTVLHEFIDGWRSIATAFYDETLRREFHGLYNAVVRLNRVLSNTTTPTTRNPNLIWVVSDLVRSRPDEDDMKDVRRLTRLTADFVAVYESYLELCQTTLYC